MNEEAIDHGPQAGCNYYSCGLPFDATNCPFTRDVPAPSPDLGNCQHEWRQVSNALDTRFYCIHCLKIVKS